MAEYGALEER